MRALLFTLMSLVFTSALAADTAKPAKGSVYKWVDDEGVVHYSDQPHENAQKVELKAPQTYTAPPRTAAPTYSSGQPQRNPGPAYQSCAIFEPTQDQMFMNTSVVTAGVRVQPAIRAGDQLVVTMDGQPIPGVPATGGQFTISPVDRGTHSLQVVVRDPTGQTVCQSPSVTFNVHQPSLQSPTNPVHPK